MLTPGEQQAVSSVMAAAAAWSPVLNGSLDAPLAATANLRQSFLGFRVTGSRKGTRFALIPSGVTISSGNLTILINGSP